MCRYKHQPSINMLDLEDGKKRKRCSLPPPPVSLEPERQLLFIFRIEVTQHQHPPCLSANEAQSLLCLRMSVCQDASWLIPRGKTKMTNLIFI